MVSHKGARHTFIPTRWLAPMLSVAVAVLVLNATAQSAGAQQPNSQQSANGADVYKQAGCVVCHGGFGTGGFGPKLAGDPMLAVQQYVIAQILIGRGQMPAFDGKLSDQQIAAVAQYIRSSWGNDFGPVSTKEVADIRDLMKRATQTAARVSQAQQP
jgi:mono/diheme cytochrome c family protein